MATRMDREALEIIWEQKYLVDFPEARAARERKAKNLGITRAQLERRMCNEWISAQMFRGFV
jgi:hypothetical protein